jgi:adenosylhomocysteine nucleosidase
VELRAHAIKKAVFAGAPAIVSFGIAGGLSSRLKPGDWIVATGVMTHDRRIETDIEWSNRLVNRLSHPDLGDIVSVADPVFHPIHKRSLRARTGASAVDMESFQAAVLAEELGVPFAAVRVIADPAHRELPIAAMLGFQADGAVAFGAVAQSLFWNPSQIPSLMRLASDARVPGAPSRSRHARPAFRVVASHGIGNLGDCDRESRGAFRLAHRLTAPRTALGGGKSTPILVGMRSSVNAAFATSIRRMRCAPHRRDFLINGGRLRI